MGEPDDDKNDNRTGNIIGLAITAVLICFSVLVLLRLEHFIVQRDCYAPHACASVGSGRNPHY